MMTSDQSTCRSHLVSVGLCQLSTTTTTNARESTAVSARCGEWLLCRRGQSQSLSAQCANGALRGQRPLTGSVRRRGGSPQPREEVVFYRLVAYRIIIATNCDNWPPRSMIGRPARLLSPSPRVIRLQPSCIKTPLSLASAPSQCSSFCYAIRNLRHVILRARTDITDSLPSSQLPPIITDNLQTAFVRKKPTAGTALRSTTISHVIQSSP